MLLLVVTAYFGQINDDDDDDDDDDNSLKRSQEGPEAGCSALGSMCRLSRLGLSMALSSSSRCCCDSPAALLLSSVVQVEEVCDHSRVVPQVLHCKLHRTTDGFDS